VAQQMFADAYPHQLEGVWWEKRLSAGEDRMPSKSDRVVWICTDADGMTGTQDVCKPMALTAG
jgi:hypothetical protein